MKKHYLFMLLYFIVMGTGLYITYHIFNSAYNSPQFGIKFLPFMALLAVMATMYRMCYKNALTLPQSTQPSYYFLIPLIPIFIITIATLYINFALSIAYLLPIIDAILIAVAEEGMFRGILLSGLARYIKPIYAVFISAFLFMSLHFLNVLAGLSIVGVVNQLVTTFLMGLFLGALYIYTRRLLYPILFHFAWDYIILTKGINQIAFAPILLIITIILCMIMMVWILWKIRNIEKLHVNH
ncbi:CPBP family intramembrane metalloprotease [Staphylococcus agnetis]|uniref:CPBP family intramembrane metalloprotease n=1 Tax=Staphylococcus agnetis TaxID=985762 RepID=A0ABD7TUR6_9STAP|nr:CPBP family intramembrane glutamic endopeptidase [Staphylococcus agnetis]UXU57352.1 CPBP family intramembrane metalloprotease [Staphylococcus agnetis]